MKAVLVRSTGGPEQLELCEVPEPCPGASQRLVDVHAAGVGFFDLLVRRGDYPQAPPLPATLGRELAGTVGSERVIGLVDGGAYAERVAAEADWLFPLPPEASFEEGAGFLISFLTAYIPLTRQVAPRPGATVLVHGAAGGVGMAAVQLARHLGARVVATAGTAARRRAALDLGAEAAYDYDEFADRVQADVIVDPVGGEVFVRSLKALRPLGTLLAVGSAGGPWRELSPALLLGRNISVSGFYLDRLLRLEPDLVRRASGELLALWSAGAVRPVVGETFPLERAAAAHRLVEARRHTGKVILVA
jgi:NADPH:quinone reductase